MTALQAQGRSDQIKPLAGQTILVLGAGMVGVCCALELQARGAQVTLIDRKGPGAETSYGNAGVIARSSLAPLNNPGLFRELPRVLTNRGASLRYRPLFLLKNLRWSIQFLASARKKTFLETTRALDELIKLSIDGHRRLVKECGLETRLSDKGWIYLYRSAAGFDRARPIRDVLEAHAVDTAPLTGDELQDHEPGLAPIFPRALWIRDSYSVNNPGAVVEGYAKTFVDRGGAVRRAEIATVGEREHAAVARLQDGEEISADQIAICLGPWGKTLLERAGYSVRMAYERGYHRHFAGRSDIGGNRNLSRPIYDTGGGYVLAPMQRGLRLTTGVELADIDAPTRTRQIQLAERSARQAIDLGEPLEARPWLGRRPTFPDSRPTIGRAPGARRLSVAFGHQHIGFATGTGTAHILADLLEGKPPPIDAGAFRPERFIRAPAR